MRKTSESHHKILVSTNLELECKVFHAGGSNSFYQNFPCDMNLD